jgi:hypothetical protein
MRQHDRRLGPAIFLNELIDKLVGSHEGVVTRVEEPHFCAESFSCALALVASRRFYALECHSRLLP